MVQPPLLAHSGFISTIICITTKYTDLYLGIASISIWSWSDHGKYSVIMCDQEHEWSRSHYADRPLYKLDLQMIPWRAVAAAAASQWELSSEMRWDRCTRSTVIAVLGGYFAGNRQRPVVNDPIKLHGDDAQCVYGP